MRTYQIELKRTSYVNIMVDADDMTEAKALAWKDIENNCVDINDADLELEFIDELKP